MACAPEFSENSPLLEEGLPTLIGKALDEIQSEYWLAANQQRAAEVKKKYAWVIETTEGAVAFEVIKRKYAILQNNKKMSDKPLNLRGRNINEASALTSRELLAAE